jgi:beta-N-acetylhexosaminidase
MKALSGNLKMRTAAARDAGCDVALHCNGEIEEMTMVLEACGPLSEEASARMARALDLLVAIEPLGDAEARFEELMAREPLRGG